MKTNGLVLAALAALGIALATSPIVCAEDGFIELRQCANCVADRDLAGDCFTPYWFAASEFSYLQIDATTGGRITLSFNDSDTAGVDAAIVPIEGMDEYTFTPRIWAGRQISEKWAVVGRYWNLTEFEQGPPEFTSLLTNFATFRRTSQAEMYTIDLEAVRSFRNDSKWKIDGSLGARHGSIFVFENLLTFGVFTTGNFVNLTLEDSFRFEGTGGTGGLTARRQIGDTNMSLFLGVRGSVLRGETNSLGRVAGTVASSPSAPLVGAATVTRNNSPDTQCNIGEAQIGLQWDYELKVIPANAFFRTAFEYQKWHIEGPPTGGAGFGGTINDLTTNSFASAGIGDAELMGISFAAGFTY